MNKKSSLSLLAALALGAGLSFWLLRRGGQAAGRPAGSPADSAPDQPAPALPVVADAAGPLEEARVLAAFGRKKRAQAVLDTAVEKGDLNAEDVALFWARHELERAKRAVARGTADGQAGGSGEGSTGAAV